MTLDTDMQNVDRSLTIFDDCNCFTPESAIPVVVAIRYTLSSLAEIRTPHFTATVFCEDGSYALFAIQLFEHVRVEFGFH